MSKISLTLLSLMFALKICAQVGISTETPDPATELHVVSPHNNTGVLIPSLTSAQLNTTEFPSPTHGMLVYNETEKAFMFNAGDAVTPIWTYIGQVPAIDNITSVTCVEKGDMRYNRNDKKIYYCNGTAWTMLKSP